MAEHIVTIGGMFGDGKTYFADSPVMIDISGLYWGDPVTSPFTVVRIEVLYQNHVAGSFREDTGGQATATFDISTALHAIWSDYGFAKEVAAANEAKASAGSSGITPGTDAEAGFLDGVRLYREYSLRVYTEYLTSDMNGKPTVTQYTDKDGNVDIPGGRCMIGGLTEWERSTIGDKKNADASHWEHTNDRYGDASTKPADTPERVGSMSITSWVDIDSEGTKSVFFPAGAGRGSADSHNAHAPLVLRDNQPYADFLFLNRRGAVESCSALVLESMGIDVNIQQYARIERPAFKPSRSLMAIGTDGRRSYQMSSGYVTREWAEWWAMEFLGGKRKQWWMRYPIGDPNGRYVPVVIQPAKNQIAIYDRTKQQMPVVEFTVTLALEG